MQESQISRARRSSTGMDKGVSMGRESPPDRNEGGDPWTQSPTSSLRASAVVLSNMISSYNICIVLTLVATYFGQTSALGNSSQILVQGNFSVGETSFRCESNIICLGTTHDSTPFPAKGIQAGRLSLIAEGAIYTQGIGYYHEPVRLLDLSTRQSASFNTSFVVDTVQGIYGGAPTPGDGMAFVISANNSTIGSSGKHFGIFDDGGITTFKSIVVEFDTWENPDTFDISDNHVSFDFANVAYSAAANTSDVGVRLGDGHTFYAWVEYDSETKQLDVRVSHKKSRPVDSLLNYSLDLADVVDEYMWVGFSSGSGNAYASSYIGNWTFDWILPSGPARTSAPTSVPTSAPTSVPTLAQTSRPTSAPNPRPTSAPTGNKLPESVGVSKKNSKTAIIVGISAGVTIFLISSLVIVALFARRSVGKVCQLGWGFGEEDSSMQLEGMPERFSFKQLSVATRAFSQESKLGQGGFGSVYRGVLPSGIPVAVKRISSDSSQGEKEFMAEVSIISRLRHRNLIQLIGWCKDASKGKYLLVYELMPNGSLDKVLFQGPTEKQTPTLSWSQRFNIVTGTASALNYLHQEWTQQVIHRDIKASNIMLDKEWNAKLGDFGLARLVDHQKEAATTLVAGTYGYIAPEVPATGRFTEKSDVFAFGAVVLEVACGRKALSTLLPENEMILVDWVWRSLSEGDLMRTVDRRLEDFDTYWMEVMLTVGLLCSHPDSLARPSMRHVVQILAGDLPVPSIPTSKPAYVPTSNSHTVSPLAPRALSPESTSWSSTKSSARSETTFLVQ